MEDAGGSGVEKEDVGESGGGEVEPEFWRPRY